jgi:hypothetical protein
VLRAVAAALALAAVVAARRRLARPRAPVRVVDPEGPPRFDRRGGARSIQAAEISLTAAQLAAVWTPVGLERLARTYWRFLSRISVGLIRVLYTDDGRLIVLGGRPLVLLSFDAPDYAIDDVRATVRWPIRGGLLLAGSGRRRPGSLQIDVRRDPAAGQAPARVRVEVAVTDFMPSLARLLGRRFYAGTQSRIHVFITHAFLRSLARLDLARSPPGRHAGG